MNLLSQSALKLENRSYLIVSEKILNWNSCLVVLKNARIFRISFFACHLNWIQFTLHILNFKTLPHFAKMILLYIEGSISIFESNQLVVHNEFELFFALSLLRIKFLFFVSLKIWQFFVISSKRSSTLLLEIETQFTKNSTI